MVQFQNRFIGYLDNQYITKNANSFREVGPLWLFLQVYFRK